MIHLDSNKLIHSDSDSLGFGFSATRERPTQKCTYIHFKAF